MINRKHFFQCTILNFDLSRLEIWNFNMGSYGKSLRGLLISRICEKFSDGGVENHGTVGKFHKNINFSLKIVSYRMSRKVISK